ncbi:hypothetical protein TrVE_jg4754 [Triparma verrucosa]|uniref:Protein kinase domain-containing protein n=1 Tax=Triparma verrucosa TaxID=1606542 RepID=A0A9W7CAW3_9STRA|nr:hypothetical protein TrVE_jg4754 [Triparma verrucosa]
MPRLHNDASTNSLKTSGTHTSTGRKKISNVKSTNNNNNNETSAQSFGFDDLDDNLDDEFLSDFPGLSAKMSPSTSSSMSSSTSPSKPPLKASVPQSILSPTASAVSSTISSLISSVITLNSSSSSSSLPHKSKPSLPKHRILPLTPPLVRPAAPTLSADLNPFENAMSTMKSLPEPIKHNDPWVVVWEKLRYSGWSYKSHSGLGFEYYYILPSGKNPGKKGGGIHQRDYLEGEREVKVFCKKFFKWVPGLAEEEIEEERREEERKQIERKEIERKEKEEEEGGDESEESEEELSLLDLAKKASPEPKQKKNKPKPKAKTAKEIKDEKKIAKEEKKRLKKEKKRLRKLQEAEQEAEASDSSVLTLPYNPSREAALLTRRIVDFPDPKSDIENGDVEVKEDGETLRCASKLSSDKTLQCHYDRKEGTNAFSMSQQCTVKFSPSSSPLSSTPSLSREMFFLRLLCSRGGDVPKVLSAHGPVHNDSDGAAKCFALKVQLKDRRTGKKNSVKIGSVMDLIAAQLAFGSHGLSDALVLKLTVLILDTLSSIHTSRVIHNDVSARSFVIGRSSSGTMACNMVGFGPYGIDVETLEEDVIFKSNCGSYNGSLFNCPYSNPSRLSLEDSDGTDKNLSFSHEPDLYGLAETVHMLLFGGRPMEVTRDRQGRFFPTAFISNFQPSKVLFERLFLLLLNPKVGVGVEEGKWEELKSCVDCLRRTVEKRCKDGKWEEELEALEEHLTSDYEKAGSVSLKGWSNIVEREVENTEAAAREKAQGRKEQQDGGKGGKGGVDSWKFLTSKHFVEAKELEINRKDREVRERLATIARREKELLAKEDEVRELEKSIQKKAKDLVGMLNKYASMEEEEEEKEKGQKEEGKENEGGKRKAAFADVEVKAPKTPRLGDTISISITPSNG